MSGNVAAARPRVEHPVRAAVGASLAALCAALVGLGAWVYRDYVAPEYHKPGNRFCRGYGRHRHLWRWILWP